MGDILPQKEPESHNKLKSKSENYKSSTQNSSIRRGKTPGQALHNRKKRAQMARSPSYSQYKQRTVTKNGTVGL